MTKEQQIKALTKYLNTNIMRVQELEEEVGRLKADLLASYFEIGTLKSERRTLKVNLKEARQCLKKGA